MFNELLCSVTQKYGQPGRTEEEKTQDLGLRRRKDLSCSLVLVNSRGDTDANKAALWKRRVSPSAPHCCLGARGILPICKLLLCQLQNSHQSEEKNSMNSDKTELLKVPVSFHRSEVHCLITMTLESKLWGEDAAQQ